MSSASPSGSVEVTPSGNSLTVVLDDGNGTRSTWQLTCTDDGAAGGDHPDAQNACSAIASAKNPWAPVPKGMACTMVYGGPQVATVRGTWDGTDVDARYERTDGCEIARWNRLAPLLQPGTPVTRSAGGT